MTTSVFAPEERARLADEAVTRGVAGRAAVVHRRLSAAERGGSDRAGRSDGRAGHRARPESRIAVAPAIIVAVLNPCAAIGVTALHAGASLIVAGIAVVGTFVLSVDIWIELRAVASTVCDLLRRSG